jgi:hypothetical protein
MPPLGRKKGEERKTRREKRVYVEGFFLLASN